MEEIEIKFLEVNISSLEKRLKSIGAIKVGETLSRITNFDYPDLSLKNEKNAWVRLRTEFGKTTLTYKERLGVSSDDGSTSDAGMKEIEVIVSDFEITKELLLNIGLVEKFSQERKRIRYIRDDIEFDIDTWPLIPPYLEIEGPTLEHLERSAYDLGLDWKDHFIGSFAQVCQKYGFSDHDYTIFTFKEQIKK